MKYKPVLHIAIAGAIVASLLLLAKGPPVDPGQARHLRFTEADVAQVGAQFERTWNRPPAPAELRGALERHVRDEVLYREALARGLDRFDPVVRMSLVRKITALGGMAAELREPTDEDLAAFFELRKERYRLPGQLSLRQLTLDPKRRGAAIGADIEKLLARFRASEPTIDDLRKLGDLRMLPNELGDSSDLARTFGQKFAAAVADLDSGRWEGPVRSGFGLHLVKVTRRRESSIPDWRDIRARITTDLKFEARKAAERQLYEEVAAQYRLEFDDAAKAALEGRAR